MTRDKATTNGTTLRVINGEATPREFKKLWDVVSDEEFAELITRCKAAAKQQGGWFMYDETTHLMGESTQAAYIRHLASVVQMNDLAQRLDPEDFAPSRFEQTQAQWLTDGRSSALRVVQSN